MQGTASEYLSVHSRRKASAGSSPGIILQEKGGQLMTIQMRVARTLRDLRDVIDEEISFDYAKKTKRKQDNFFPVHKKML